MSPSTWASPLRPPDAPAGRRGQAAAPDERPQLVQRGLPRRRACRGTSSARWAAAGRSPGRPSPTSAAGGLQGGPARAEGRAWREAIEERTAVAEPTSGTRSGPARELVAPLAGRGQGRAPCCARDRPADRAHHAAQVTAERAAAASAEGRPPGPEGSIGKLASSGIARQAARVHGEIAARTACSPARSALGPARSPRSSSRYPASRSPAAPTRSSTTSSGSGFWACRASPSSAATCRSETYSLRRRGALRRPAKTACASTTMPRRRRRDPSAPQPRFRRIRADVGSPTSRRSPRTGGSITWDMRGHGPDSPEEPALYSRRCQRRRPRRAARRRRHGPRRDRRAFAGRLLSLSVLLRHIPIA